MKPFLLLTVIVLLGAACSGSENAVPTVAQPASTPIPLETNSLPPTTDISTAQPANAAPALETPNIQPGSIITGDDFLPIDAILDEIDNDVCQDAYETKLELEASIAEGADLAELETAIEELIAELENCPTPTP